MRTKTSKCTQEIKNGLSPGRIMTGPQAACVWSCLRAPSLGDPQPSRCTWLRHLPASDLPSPSPPPSRREQPLSRTDLANRQRCVGMWCVAHVDRFGCQFFFDATVSLPTVDLCSVVADTFERIISNPFFLPLHHPFRRAAPRQGLQPPDLSPALLPALHHFVTKGSFITRTGTCLTSTLLLAQIVLP